MHDQEVERDLHDCVDELKLQGLLGIGEERSKRVEKRLQTHPHKLAEGRAEESCLEDGGDVCVDDVLALVLVVLQVVPLEGHGEGDADGEVGEDAEAAVEQRPLDAEAGAVGDLVDGEHEGVVDDAAEEVGGEDDDGPRLVPHEEEHAELEEHERQHLELEHGVDAKQLLDLWVLFWNRN